MADEINTNKDSGQDGQENTENVTFATFLETADPTVKAAYEQHAAGLLNTVKATRDERDEFKKQLKELLPEVEKGSKAEKTLTEFAAKLEIAERRAAFIEESIKPGVSCRNPKAAYALAVSLDAFDKRGNPDWVAIKAEAPELFGKFVPNARSGEGTDEPPNLNDINAQIRRKAGR